MADRGGAVRRLGRASLAEVLGGGSAGALTPPPEAGLSRQVGILHLGIGAFHRAHQAVYTEDAAVQAGQPGWGICGVTQRSAGVVDQLMPQDGLYGLLVRGDGDPRLRVVGQVSQVLFPEQARAELTDRFADPAVRVVTLTVTEKGYRRDAAGRLDVHDPVLAADLAGQPPGSAVGQLVRGLQARARAVDAPVTVLACDNLTDNGHVLAGLVGDFCAALPAAEGEPLAEWIARQVAFPCSMVDRIVPATTDADRQLAADLLGLRDEGLVVAEPFRQWVIEDDFAAARPAWEKVGAELVADVRPYEQLKLRLLNGTHSMLAYLGALAGYETIAQAVADPGLAEQAQALMTTDVLPTLSPPPGVDAGAYARTVLERFANPALAHRTVQVAMDGSQKLPLRLLGTVRDNLAAGRTPRWAGRAVAGWMAYVALGADRRGRALPLDDPMADRLRAAVRDRREPAGIVEGLLGVGEIFGADLPEEAALRDCLTQELAELMAGQA